MLDAENRVQEYDQATIDAAVKIIDGYIQKTIFAGDAARLRHAKADILKLGRAAEPEPDPKWRDDKSWGMVCKTSDIGPT